MAAVSRRRLRHRPGAGVLACLVGLLLAASGHAASELAITSITPEGAGLRITWQGGTPPYQLERQANPTTGIWEAVGDPTTESAAALPVAGSSAFLRVLGRGPQAFAGASTCGTCHRGRHSRWSETAHAHALETLKAIGQGANTRCLGCHTVGFRQPSGYVNEATTPHLAGVQCENCHGGAAEHAADPRNAALRPIVDLAGALCGSCHTGAHHAMYDEWALSRHASALGGLLASGHSRDSCLMCHSQDYRHAVDEGQTPPTLATAKLSIECTTCHESHGGVPQDAQLRKPVGELCGECHTQGETLLGQAPHHPQYEMLKGEGAYQQDGSALVRSHIHSLLAAQEGQACAQCHVIKHEVEAPNSGNPNVTGHTFNPFDASIAAHQGPEYTGCILCHTEEQAHELRTEQQAAITERLEDLAPYFDRGSPAYIDPDDLSQANGARLQVAKFNYQFVEADGSRGVHNPAMAGQALNVAETIIHSLVPAP